MSEFLKTGILGIGDIEIPPATRRQKGRVVMIECVQRIPCNPCTEVCPQGAITIEGDITNVPHVDFDKCNGCGICIANCPGLAIFAVDESLGDDVAEVGLPYEFRPLPEKGEIVELIDRAGGKIGVGKVKRALSPKSFDKTAVVYLMVPKKLSLEVRFFKRTN
ncbi:MAG: 4Fe-4S ferredoxin [Calditrichaeota bacterium]|nr:4Fe-4S ferredoxin [Calditrichota bacterium]